MRVRPHVIVGVALGLVVACPRTLPYVCETDDDCDLRGLRGRCLADDACAYPDPDCESGWVRSALASARAGECVPTGGEGESTAAGSEGSGDVGGSADAGTTVDPQPTCGQRSRFEVATAFLGVSEVFEGYPLLVTTDDVAIVAAIAEAQDEVGVATDDGTFLAIDVERVDVDAGTAVLWVRLPEHAPGEPLPLWLHLGAAVSGDAAATWAERYVGVWHLGDGLSGQDGDELRNAASPSEPARTVGEMAPTQSVDGVFGRGLLFDGVDDRLQIDAAFVGQLDSYTLSMWARYDGDGTRRGHYFYRLNGDFHYPRCWRFGEELDGSANIFCQYQQDGESPTALSTGRPHPVGELVHLAVVRDADAATHRVYVDGEEVAVRDDVAGAALVAGDATMLVGGGESIPDDPVPSYDGMIDEIRVSAAPIPASWIRADVRTQREPGAAVGAFAPLEPSPCDEG